MTEKRLRTVSGGLRRFLDRLVEPAAGTGTAANRLERLRDLALALTAVVACGLYFWAFRNYSFEDAYITFRYADNIASGNGFVFHPGERVLGTSTPFFALLLGFLGFLGLDIPKTALFLNASCLSLIAAGGAWIARRYGHANLGVAFALTVLWGAGGITHFFGMETVFYAVLMLAALIAALAERRLTAGVLLGLASLTRYDGVLFALPMLGLLWLRGRRIPWRAGLAFSAVMVPWLVFAFFYFGSVMPNTLGAKSHSEPMMSYLFVSLVRLTDRFFLPMRGLLLGDDRELLEAVLLLLLVGHLLTWSRRVLRREILLGMLLIYPVFLWLGYSYIGPPTKFQWYLLPGMYLFLLGCLLTWGEALASRRLGPAATLLSLVLIAGSLAALPSRVEEDSQVTRSYRYRRRAEAYERLAGVIRRNGLQDLEILTPEPGYLTYQSKNPVIDAAGLVTEDIRFHGPVEERTSLKKTIDTRRPPMMVFGEHDKFLEKFPEYRPVYFGTLRALYMRDEVYRERVPDLARDWLGEDGYYPQEVEAGHPLSFDFESADVDAAGHLRNGWWGASRLVERPTGLTYAGAPVEEDVLTSRTEVVGRDVSTLSSPPFHIDFDELSFRLAAGDAETRAELLVNGLQVLVADGAGRQAGVMEDVRWPVVAWRGKVGVLRLVDRADSGWLAADHVASSAWSRREVWEDFESGVYGDRWLQGLGERPASYEEVARELGLSFILGHFSAVSLFSDSWQGMESRPFVIDHDEITFLVYDFGGEKTQVLLKVGDRVVHRFVGGLSNRLQPVDWPVRALRGKSVVLEVFDHDNRPGRGIGIDEIVFYDR